MWHLVFGRRGIRGPGAEAASEAVSEAGKAVENVSAAIDDDVKGSDEANGGAGGGGLEGSSKPTPFATANAGDGTFLEEAAGTPSSRARSSSPCARMHYDANGEPVICFNLPSPAHYSDDDGEVATVVISDGSSEDSNAVVPPPFVDIAVPLTTAKLNGPTAKDPTADDAEEDATADGAEEDEDAAP